MKNSDVVRTGQVWKYGGKTYTIGAIRHGQGDLELFQDDRCVNNHYGFDGFNKGDWNKGDWKLQMERLTQCPECNAQEVPVLEGDFMCQVCREKQPVSLRVIMTHEGIPAILNFSFEQNQMTILKNGDELLALDREDLSQSVINKLRSFLDG